MILSVCKESCRVLQSDFFLTTQHGSKLPSHIYCAIYFLSRYKIYIYLYRIYPLVFVFYHCPCKICWFCWFITEMGRSQHRGRNRRWEKDQLQNQGADAGSQVWTFWSILCTYDNFISMVIIFDRWFQASWYVQNLLYSLCREINRVGGHAVQRWTNYSIFSFFFTYKSKVKREIHVNRKINMNCWSNIIR